MGKMMGQIDVDKIREIYGLLGDDLSKEIYENRLMYSLTGDMKFIRNVVCTIDIGRETYNRLRTSSQPKVIFGVGSVGKRLVRIYEDIRFECFVDNNCAGQEYKKIPVINIEALKEKYHGALIIISSNRYHKEMLKQLLDEGFEKENIVNIGMEYEKLNHLQYFDLPQLEKRRMSEEIFVDGGCYDGSNSLDFQKWCSDSKWGGHIYAWEPDTESQEKCRKKFDDNHLNYELIPKGLWSETRELKFKMDGTSSAITDMGDVIVEVDSIDNLIKKPVTFIKMDVEGSEYQALLGARNMIEKHRPKLAICIYHKMEDIWELPWLIHELHSGYKFYLRHYSFGDVETVLYAL